MTDNKSDKCVMLCLVFLIAGLGVGATVGVIGEMRDIDAMRKDAAEKNAGRWVVEEKTGKTTWEWTGRTP